MTRKDNIQNLIANHNRRLQKLKEMQALFGASTEPRILIEIEDIETEIGKLQTELEELEDNSKKPTPLYHSSIVSKFQNEPQRTPSRIGNNEIRYKILNLLDDARTAKVSRTLSQEELVQKINLPLTIIQSNLFYLIQKGYVEQSKTNIGVRDYKFYEITSEGIDLLENTFDVHRPSSDIIINIHGDIVAHDKMTIGDISDSSGIAIGQESEAIIDKRLDGLSTREPRIRTTYNLAAIHHLLTAVFTDETLRDFCYNSPLFRPASEQFSRSIEYNEMIKRLIEYVEVQDLFENLLAAIKEINPRQYANYEAQLQ